MIVGRGRTTVCAFDVIGPNMPTDPDECIETLKALAFDGFSAGEGQARGWISTDHLLDLEFSREKNFRAPFLVFGLRIDKRRVIPAVYRARCIIELKAAQDAMGGARVPIEHRREIRRRVKEEMLQEATPSSQAFGVAWNLRRRRLSFSTTSRSALRDLSELFDRCFALSLAPRVPETLGFAVAEQMGLSEAFANLEPSPLFAGVAGDQ